MPRRAARSTETELHSATRDAPSMTVRQRLSTPAQTRMNPTIAVKANTAADALDISLGSFLSLVREGKMPKPIIVPGHSGLVLYDFEAVRSAWQTLTEAGNTEEANEWDQN